METNTLNLAQLERLSFDLFRQTCVQASHVLIGTTTSNRQARPCAESLLFIQGTGLEVFIQSFAWAINPDRFREVFEGWCVTQRRHHQMSPSSSATIRVISSNAV